MARTTQRLFRRRPDPEAWSIEPGSLPQEWVVRREPRLAGLEDNPAYRYARMRARRWRFVNQPPEVWLSLALPLIFLLPVGRHTPLVVAWFAVLGLVRRFHRPEITGEAILGTMSTAVVADLSLAGVKPDEIAAGLWGAAVRGPVFRRSWRSLALGFLLNSLGILVVFQILRRSGFFATGCMLAVAYLAALRVLEGFKPAWQLWRVADTIGPQRQRIQSQIDPGSRLASEGGPPLNLLIVLLFGAGFVLVVATPLEDWLGGLPDLLGPVGGWIAWGAMAAGVGTAIGWMIGRIAASNAFFRFRDLTRDVAYLMEYARIRVHEPGANVRDLMREFRRTP